jgi:formate dehydrogenase maturation protein FdhE
MDSGFWQRQIARADELARRSVSAKELLVFYSQLLRAQKETYEFLRNRRGWLPSGDLRSDLAVVREAIPNILKTVEEEGPLQLAEEAKSLSLSGPDDIDDVLLAYWVAPTGLHFLAKACLQPYARWLADTNSAQFGSSSGDGERHCPFCGGQPQVSFLSGKKRSSESAKRDLLCAKCLSVWTYRHMICANCGEERPGQLGYFSSPEYEHIRVETCETCKHYLKEVDLTRLFFAAPLVDEVAAAFLDLLAREQGYSKIELNLVGL